MTIPILPIARKLVMVALLATMLSAGALVALPEAASAAPGTPTTSIHCARNQVTITAPRVTAQQPMVGSRGPDAWWIVAIYKWTGSGWQFVQWSDYFVSAVYADNGFPLGSTWGYAGPNWQRYNTYEATTTSLTFNLPSGFYTAVNWVNDNTGWSSGGTIATTGNIWCQA